MDKQLVRKLEKDLKNQLRQFKNAKEKNYESYRFYRDRCLVKVFKFKPSDETVQMSQSAIMIQSPLNGEWRTSYEVNNEKLFPIVKVIKKGSEAPDWVKEGNLYTVPYNDVVGDTWNPDFQWMMQNFAKKNNKGKPGIVTIPDDMEQRIPKLDVHWERYKFSMPDRIGKEEEEDKIVYLIPSLKLEADYIL